MTAKRCFLIFVMVSALALMFLAAVVVYVDPFFHYHKPYTDRFFYTLNNERSQNDGIIRHFDFDAVVTGSSMAGNIRTSEADALFGVRSVMLPYEGATYHEIHLALDNAFRHNPDIRVVIRALDMLRFFEDHEAMRDDLGAYPDYLYNNNPFDDVKYVLNRDVLFGRCYPMIRSYRLGENPGITSFDRYGRWMPDDYTQEFGKDHVLAGRTSFSPPEPDRIQHVSEEDIARITANINENVIADCQAHPETTFYYFITPFSTAWWGGQWEYGSWLWQIEGEEHSIRMILESGCDNIRLYSFNNFTDITANLDNYRDPAHYADWINSLMLTYMHDGTGLLTRENYEAYIEEEKELYSNYDYNGIFDE